MLMSARKEKRSNSGPTGCRRSSVAAQPRWWRSAEDKMLRFIKIFIAVALVFWATAFALRYYLGSAEPVLPMMFTAGFVLLMAGTAVSLLMGCARAVIRMVRRR